MKRVCLTALVLAAAALAAPGSDISGTWKVRYSGPPNTEPKTVGSIVLELKVDGDEVTGMVHVGAWPGDAPIADAKIEGGLITFTATGTRGSTTGIPTNQFEVRIDHEEMTVIMTTIRNPGGPLSAGRRYEFKGTKVPGVRDAR